MVIGFGVVGGNCVRFVSPASLTMTGMWVETPKAELLSRAAAQRHPIAASVETSRLFTFFSPLDPVTFT
jgi:hypothetical protein